MELKAQLIDILPEDKGTSAKGEWRKQDLIVELPDIFKRKVCITRWNALIDSIELQTGIYYNFTIQLQSKTFNNKWYTTVIAKNIRPLTQQEIEQLQPITLKLTDD